MEFCLGFRVIFRWEDGYYTTIKDSCLIIIKYALYSS